MECIIKENENIKILKSSNYNYWFNKFNGRFLRWGKDKDDDPDYCKFGPEILDLELSTICHRNCKWCYKGNSSNGKNMSFDTFKRIFDNLPKTITQIAFGIGSIDGNEDLEKILTYTRNKGVIPNITINGERMTPYYYDMLSKVCGAVAISLYDYDTCYDAVKELTDRGLKQVNIHCLLSQETESKCWKVLKDIQSDSRINKLNAVVFLWLKNKGDRNNLHQIQSLEKYKQLVDYALDNNLPIGFDSCSASNFTKTIKNRNNYSELDTMIDSCESCCFSYYVNVDGRGYPCSFCEGEKEFKGINTLVVKDFIKEVWFGKETVNFRNKLLNNKDCNGCRRCQVFNLELK